MASVTVRPATEADLPALARIDTSYPTGRLLALERSGDAPEHTFRLRWRQREPGTASGYPHYTGDWFRQALSRADLFLVADVDGRPAGLLMIVVPSWTDAGEITDLAVHRPLRRRGAPRALVQAAIDWGRGRSLRSLWVEPRADNAEAIDFYLALGFRLSGFNDRLYSNRDHEDGRPTLYLHLELT
ncbi:MAG: GNAT family N-acetyltransferase [Chloroflexi bacterium]|nr:GNAT family N-acetyltransferase [Chloroflexota bacterium]